jgi:hypothetical protein
MRGVKRRVTFGFEFLPCYGPMRSCMLFVVEALAGFECLGGLLGHLKAATTNFNLKNSHPPTGCFATNVLVAPPTAFEFSSLILQ